MPKVSWWMEGTRSAYWPLNWYTRCRKKWRCILPVRKMSPFCTAVFCFVFTVIFVYSIFIFLTLSQNKFDIVDCLFYSVFWSLFSPMSCCIGLAICILFEFEILFFPSQCWIYWKLNDHVWFVLMKVHSKRQNEEEAVFRAPVGGFYPTDAADCVPVSLSTNYLFCVCRVKRFGQSLCKQHSGRWAKGNEKTLCVFV